MKTANALLILSVVCLLTACSKTTRSISQSGYHDNYSYAGLGSRELDEFDVLGVDRNSPVTEEDIQHAVKQRTLVRLSPGSTILLVQSGAVFPDGRMVAELDKTFRVVPFTGIPGEQRQGGSRTTSSRTRNLAVVTDGDDSLTVVPLATVTGEAYTTAPPKRDAAAYSRLLRLAAARAGASAVVCYWGILESGTEEIATKTISWIPTLNWVLPDERQHMRITLKMAVVDVQTGNWSVFSVQPKETSKWSARSRREAVDQKQVELLKTRVYEMAAHELIGSYRSTTPMQ